MLTLKKLLFLYFFVLEPILVKKERKLMKLTRFFSFLLSVLLPIKKLEVDCLK